MENSVAFVQVMRHVPMDSYWKLEQLWKIHIAPELEAYLLIPIADLIFEFIRFNVTETERCILDWLLHYMQCRKCEQIAVKDWNSYERSACYRMCNLLGLSYHKEFISRPRDKRLGSKKITIFMPSRGASGDSIKL